MKHQLIFSGLILLLLSTFGKAQVNIHFDEAISNLGTNIGQNSTALVTSPNNSFSSNSEKISIAENSQDEVIYQYQESAFLGVNIADMSESKAKKLGLENPYGTYVSSVIKNSAADKGGIKPLDYIHGNDV